MLLENLYHINESVVTSSMCDDIIKISEQKDLTDATTRRGPDENHISEYRKSKIAWLKDKKLEASLSDLISIANKESNWLFSLTEFEPLQYTIYHPNDHYDWHIDSRSKPYPNGLIRKLSFTLCLTDDYTGGEFEIAHLNPKPDKHKFFKFDKTFKKGTMIVFPSFVWHKVNPVLSGTRKVLVGWVVGTPFI